MNSSQPQPKVQLRKSADYRETYANSVQVRVSVWDFFLNFGVAHQDSPDQINVENNHGVYLSPQQAKALWNMLGQNLAQYEQAFGAIALEPHGAPMPMPSGPVH
jgi:flagellar protein FlaG